MKILIRISFIRHVQVIIGDNSTIDTSNLCHSCPAVFTSAAQAAPAAAAAADDVAVVAVERSAAEALPPSSADAISVVLSQDGQLDENSNYTFFLQVRNTSSCSSK